jgi:polysaccharide biosynthesis/export protein
MRTVHLAVRALCFGLAVLHAVTVHAQAARDPGNYIVGPQDVLRVNVWNQSDLSGQYTVERDGTFSFPLVGRVDVKGLTLRAVEAEITRLLADGYFRNPQVTVAVLEYRSQRIFVVGELRTPGTYPLTGDMTLIEALARAGSTTVDSADHVLVLRANGASGPLLPGQPGAAEIIRVETRPLERAESQNFLLRDGDTVFVPRALNVYVFGHVRTPGSYPVTSATTVLQALSLAGGVTEYGATNRVKVVRVVDGREQQVKVKLNAVVQPGDTIIVPARYF